MVSEQETAGSAASSEGSQAVETAAANQPVYNSHEVESLKSQISDLKAMFEQQNKPKEIVYTHEQLQEIAAKDPAKLMQIMVDQKVREITAPALHQADIKAQQRYWDSKLDTEFPLLNKEPAFKNLVSEQFKKLVDAGMPKDSPKAVYTAAEQASLVWEVTQNKKKASSSGASGEAPSSISGQQTAKAKADKLTSEQEAWALVMKSNSGMNDEKYKRVMERAAGKIRDAKTNNRERE